MLFLEVERELPVGSSQVMIFPSQMTMILSSVILIPHIFASVSMTSLGLLDVVPRIVTVLLNLTVTAMKDPSKESTTRKSLADLMVCAETMEGGVAELVRCHSSRIELPRETRELPNETINSPF